MRLFRWRRKTVAQAGLRGEYGTIKQTGSNPKHHTWWPVDGLDPEVRAQLFSTVERVK
ncbi:MAG: hypothetical protein ACI8S6_004818 [Myxococcota bacterium]|jgi:hypothetical protein